MYVFLLALFLFRDVACDSVFRFGAVLSTDGASQEIELAKKGYELYFDTLHARSNGRGFFVKGKPGTQGFYFTYAFLHREDFSDPQIHAQRITELIADEKVHFLGGSHADYAEEEMRAAKKSGVLSYQCCVDSEIYEEMDVPSVFGISGTRREYTKNFLAASLLVENQRFAFVYDAADPDKMAACKGGRDLLEASRTVDGDAELIFVRTYDASTDDREAFLRETAAEAKKQGVDTMIACLSEADGKRLLEELHEAEYSLKSTFLTSGPVLQDWVDSFEDGNRVHNLFSACQWHWKMKYLDAYFESAISYAELYRQTYGETPMGKAAAASAVGLTLTQAIKNAFKSCDISRSEGDVDALLYDTSAIECDDDLGDRGYDRVLAALSLLDMETFFGRVKFNHYRRNHGLQLVSTQVFVETAPDGTEKREIESVMPVIYASHLAKFPAKNFYKEDCQPGFFVGPDEFDPCVPCQKGETSYEVNTDHCDDCPVGEWMNKIGRSSCNKCPEGTITKIKGSKKLSDCVCKPGYFNVAGEPGAACEPCPVGAECPGGTERLIPLPEYWVNETTRNEVYACSLPGVCTGGSDRTCVTGHTGRLCAECEDGYFSALQMCCRCLGRKWIIFLMVALLVGWYVINVIVSRSVASLEMILGWAQLANIIGDINLNWTKMMAKMFGVANLLDFDVDILEPSCIVPWGFKQNCVMQLLLPFVMTTMAASGYVGSALVYFLIHSKRLKLDERQEKLLSVFVEVPESKEQLQKKWDATLAAFLAAVDVTYVTIAKYCFDVFRCDTIAGVSVLREAPEVLCGSADHKVLIVLASLGIAFYVVGYLAYISWKLYDLSRRRVFYEAVNLRRFGFVYEKFELEYYYTPAIIIVRKLVFVLVLVYMNNPAFQVGVLAVVINVSLMLQVYTAPYVDTYLDVLFSFLLVALMCEAFGGLMFYSDNLPSANRKILELVVLISFLVLAVVFVAIFVMEIIKKYQVRYIKKQQMAFARQGLGSSGRFFHRQREPKRSLNPSESSSSIGSNADDATSFELVDTFDPGFVYRSIKRKPSSIKDWDTLTNMLKDFMSDQSETSYLSMEPVAKFWRKLVDRFPELVDFLAVAGDETREKFKDVATILYRNFYLTNKVTPLPLLKIMNWRDYAPMAHWLAIAPADNRAFFRQAVAEMFDRNGKEEASEMLLSKISPGMDDRTLERRAFSQGRSLSHNQHWVLQSFRTGSNPFAHPAYRRRLDPTSLVNQRIREYLALQKELQVDPMWSCDSIVLHSLLQKDNQETAAATASMQQVSSDKEQDSPAPQQQ